MIIKNFELKNKISEKINYYLLYGTNIGQIEDAIKNIFKPVLSKNIIHYDEADILKNEKIFKEQIFNKSFFENEKLIIISRATDKIFEIINEIIETEIEDTKIIIKAESLEKKSKLRNFFEKRKNVAITAFYEDNFQSLSAIVQDFLKENKIKISSQVISLIIKRSKGSRINLNNELEKIFLFSKSNKKISYENIFKLTNLFENYNFSELIDCCLLKNSKKTIDIINENNLNNEEDILILKSFLFKLKRLKKIKNEQKKTQNIDEIFRTFKPAIFWKEKEIVKQQLKVRSISDIMLLIKKINNLELIIKKNSHASSLILNNFIIESSENSNSLF